MALKALGITVVFFYTLAACAYLFLFITQRRSWKPVPSLLFTAGAVLHFAHILILTTVLGRIPIVSVYGVLTSATFLFALVYLVLEVLIQDKSMGVLITPLLVIFLIIGLTGIDLTPKDLPVLLQGLSFRVHVVFMLLAYSGFTIAFLASSMHLLLANEIHQKRLGFFYSRIPSLELLDRLNGSAVILGFAFSTVGMFLGCYMALQSWGNPMPLDPKFISFFLTWALYFFHLFARMKLGWRGERSSYLSLAGFLWILVNLFIISVYLTKLHLYI